MDTRLPALLLALCALPASAAEPGRDAESLHKANCVACHVKLTGGDAGTMYTRPNHKVSSFEGLKQQVRRCDANLGLRWFDEDLNAVSKYLNQTYYHFQE